jgi:hypothetical protein
MTWSDPIVEEVRRARDAYAARFNYDLCAMYRDLKEKETQSGRQVVSYAEGPTGVEPTEALPPSGPPSTAADNVPPR